MLLLLTASGCLACGAGPAANETTDDGAGTTGTSAGETTAGGTTTGETGAGGTTAGEATAGETTGTPEAAECLADLQDCPDGFKCVLRRGDADWEFVCLPVQGDHQAGEACQHDGVIAGTDDCDQDSWCIGSFDTTGAPWQGLCYPLCVGGACELDQRCVGIGALPVCAPICDPLIDDACGEAEACIFREPEGFVCFPQGNDGHELGEGCETAISCVPGMHCAQHVAGCAPEDYCCTDYCDAGGDTNTCAAQGEGASCVAIGATDPTQAHVGACVVPE